MFDRFAIYLMLDFFTSELFADMIPCMFDRVAIYLMLDLLTSELFADMIQCNV